MFPRPNPVPAPRRLVVVGSVIAEIVMSVPDLPVTGGGTRASRSVSRAGGGFHVLVAARRAGLETALAGVVGTGPMAQLVAARLQDEDVHVLLPSREGDQGFVVVLAEPDGTTAQIASPGVEATLDADDLAKVRLRDDDVAYLSARDLLEPTAATAIARWCDSDAGLAGALLVLDPGPLVADVPDDVLDAVLERTDVLAVGVHELELLGGGGGDRERVLADLADLLAPEGIVLLRLADDHFVVHEQGAGSFAFPADAPGPPRLAQVRHLLAQLAELRSARSRPADLEALPESRPPQPCVPCSRCATAVRAARAAASTAAEPAGVPGSVRRRLSSLVSNRQAHALCRLSGDVGTGLAV